MKTKNRSMYKRTKRSNRMKKTNCLICKKKTEKPFKEPLIEKQIYPICSKECYSIYLCCWKDEKNFPENLNNTQRKKNNADGSNTHYLETQNRAGEENKQEHMPVGSHSSNTMRSHVEKHSKEQIEEFPDY
jgi:endogenous inhibitor of DNA gyrase (YacG/DUF329 family)